MLLSTLYIDSDAMSGADVTCMRHVIAYDVYAAVKHTYVS